MKHEPQTDKETGSDAHHRASNARRAARYRDDGRDAREQLAQAAQILARQKLGLIDETQAQEQLEQVFGKVEEGERSS
jgi:hypothetical protein